jgi:phospholipid transport system substrate-binding protein
MKKISLFLLFFLIFIPLKGLLAEEQPVEEIRKTIDEVVQVVERLPGDQNLDQRREELRVVINPRFDFEEMARRSLGAHWQDRTEAERQEFVKVFSNLLANTYLARIETVERGMVEVGNQNVQGQRALVRTFINYRNERFPLDYRLIKTDEGWKVYDVIIENIGLVVNYRNEFASIIRREQFSGLMTRLKEKSAERDSLQS